MSELIQQNDNRATIRWKLLTGASALALTAYVASAGGANADDADHPLVWIELGGQMETIEGLSAPIVAPFMTLTPTPDVYKGISFLGSQRPAQYSFGEEAAITFQPENSDWSFSAGIRYGRSHSNRHKHNQAGVPSFQYTVIYSVFGSTFGTVTTKYTPDKKLADTRTRSSEQHLILDFQAGKDVGLGLLGHQGTSTINAGVRFASFTAKSSAYITARPSIDFRPFTVTRYSGLIRLLHTAPNFYQYTMQGQAARSFKGIGPTLSWNASAAIAGNPQDGQLMLDWGVNAALLFGKQTAKVEHTTQAYHYYFDGAVYGLVQYVQTYHHPHHSTRSRSVSVPNIGGYAGLSVKYTDVKISIGYRYDTFLNAMDTGIDATKKSNLTFNGPYASISIGIGD